MRSELEMRAMIATLADEYARANDEMIPDPIRITSMGSGVYQVTIRQTMERLAISINTLRWALGEIELPVAQS